MSNVTIENLCEIFWKIANIDFCDESLRNKMLFGNDLHIKPRELFMVCMELKQKYNICFSESALLEKKLLTFNSFVEIVIK